MLLIADGGSTKTSWCLVAPNKKFRQYFQTEGYNPYFVDINFIVNSFNKNAPGFVNMNEVSEIHFYGAGCSVDKSSVIHEAMSILFPKATIEVQLDILAAARASLGRSPGFAAILGTGTNTCLYDGVVITKNIDSLGFVMGDEGSGASIGRKLLSDFMRGFMPADVHEQFTNVFKKTPDEIMHEIYTQPMANRYCAGFCKYVNENIGHPYFHQLVKTAFTEFFENLVCRYPNYREYSFNCVGSLAYNFRNILEETSRENQMEVGKIIREPIAELVEYHTYQSI